MTVVSFSTPRVTSGSHSLTALVDAAVKNLPQRSVLAITSKVVALCESRTVDRDAADKDHLIRTEAERYLPRSSSRYDVSLTIKGNTLIPSSGIDESNTGGDLVLWPADPAASADAIWNHLREHHGHAEFGVILTDSTTAPLRIGVVGISIAHAGFAAVNDFVGKDDLFGRPLAMTQANVTMGLAAAAVTVMGEAAEQTPFALLTDLPFVRFQRRTPTSEERASLAIDPEDDLYAPLLDSVQWREGGPIQSARENPLP